MKVVYFSKSFFADCDFPLVKGLQNRGVDVCYYIPIKRGFRGDTIIEFSKPWKKWGIYKASKMADMQPYKDCVNLDRLYFISGYSLHIWDISAWILWIYAMIHIFAQRADVWHITWQLGRYERFLLKMPYKGKKVMTVHDPLQHSGNKNYIIQEYLRKKCFRWSEKFILLNNEQVGEFCNNYGIKSSKIYVSRLGAYDSMLSLQVPKSPIIAPYIVFFGQISPNKGVEYLVEAMKYVHKSHPDVRLLVAGKGKIYFDDTLYRNLDYIIWDNRFIGIKDLISYVRGSLFAICPYKDATQSGVIQTAFSLETPVVATNVGNFPDAVKDGEFGLIVPPCDSPALAEAICKLLSDRDKLNRMVYNIKEKWMRTMSWDTIVQDYIDVYCEE